MKLESLLKIALGLWIGMTLLGFTALAFMLLFLSFVPVSGG